MHGEILPCLHTHVVKQALSMLYLSGHSKIDKTKVLKTDGNLMQVDGSLNAQCSLGAFCHTFDLR